MKAFLMFRDRDFDLQRALPPNAQVLTADLELDTLFKAMADKDEFLLQAARTAVLTGFDNDQETILYRQNILKDCLENPLLVRQIYGIAIESLELERKNYWGFSSRHPESILRRSVEVVQMFMGMLKKLRLIAEDYSDQFESEGFARFFAMLRQELDDAYFALVQDHLRELRFRDGVLISAKLGQANKGTQYVLRRLSREKSWRKRLFGTKPPSYTYTIPDRDENGAAALAELNDRGVNLVANVLAQSAEHVLSFFRMLQTELAFYIGCLNLQARLAQLGAPFAFPVPAAPAECMHSFHGLYDICLALTMNRQVVGNAGNANHKNLVIVTGANQGGKSTFLRSIGLSQLMMQCGMFVPAESLCANLCDHVFTHYKREEDLSMQSGKLDEELARMSQIVDQLTSNSMVLFNESFAATNEREGSEIARQIVRALLDKQVKVFFVTHLYEFARSSYDERMESALFLRAERQPDGTRTFRVIPGEPLETSYGKDLYDRIFKLNRTGSTHD